MSENTRVAEDGTFLQLLVAAVDYFLNFVAVQEQRLVVELVVPHLRFS